MPGSPPVSLLPSGTGESCHQPGHLPRSSAASSTSPAPSPALHSRLSTSLSTGRANGTASASFAHITSSQTQQGSTAGPGSDGESLCSSSSSLESPTPTGPPQLPGTSLAAGPGLKKVPSHSIFPAELEHPLHGATTSYSSLPTPDLHIAEEPAMGTLSPDPLPCGTQSPVTHQPSCSPYSGSEAAPGLPTVCEGLGAWDAAPHVLPQPQLRVSLGASPGPAHRPPPLPPSHGEAPTAPSLGRAEGLLPPPAPQAAPFKLVSQPQTVQVSSQPAFLGGLVLVPALATPAVPSRTGTNPPRAELVRPWGSCMVTAAPGEGADGGWAVVTPEHGRTRSRPLCPLGPPCWAHCFQLLPVTPPLPPASPALPTPG